MAHSDAFATQFTSASDQSGHTSRRRSVAVECNGATPRLAGSRSISRPSDRSTEPASGLGPFGSRSLRQAPAAYATPASITRTIRTGAVVPPACCTMAAASTYIRSSASGSYQNPAYSWQLGSKMDRDSSLVRLIGPTRHPQSHIRPGIGPEAWAKLIQLIK